MSRQQTTGRKLKWLEYLFALIAGLYLVELVTGLVMAFAKYKLKLALHWQAILTKLALHPLHYYQLYLGKRNPLLIIGSAAVVMYVVYFMLKRNSKNKAWQTADTDTHGSAVWGSVEELISRHLFKSTQAGIVKNFNEEINQDILAEFQKRK